MNTSKGGGVSTASLGKPASSVTAKNLFLLPNINLLFFHFEAVPPYFNLPSSHVFLTHILLKHTQMFQTAPPQQVPPGSWLAAAPAREGQSQRLPAGHDRGCLAFPPALPRLTPDLLPRPRAPAKGGQGGRSSRSQGGNSGRVPRSPPRAPQRALPAPRERRPGAPPAAGPARGGQRDRAGPEGTPRLRGDAAALTAPGRGLRLREGGREQRHQAPRRRSGGGPGACAARGPGWAGPDVSELPRGGGVAMAGE